MLMIYSSDKPLDSVPLPITTQFQALAAAARDAGGAVMVTDNADVAADGGNEG